MTAFLYDKLVPALSIHQVPSTVKPLNKGHPLGDMESVYFRGVLYSEVCVG